MAEGTSRSMKGILAGVAIILIASATVAFAGHFVHHDASFEEKLAASEERVNIKLAKLAENLANDHEELKNHEAQPGIHQDVQAQQNAMFKVAVDVVDARFQKLVDSFDDLRQDIQAFRTTERENLIERLLKLETQQATILKRLDELQAELKKPRGES